MDKKFTLLVALLLIGQTLWAQGTSSIYGKIKGEEGQGLFSANIYIKGTDFGASTNGSGNFQITNIPAGKYEVAISMIGYLGQVKQVELQEGAAYELNLSLKPQEQVLHEVEVFGAREKQPEKLETITRLPLKPSEQIQSISVISERLIEMQGNLTISEATRNVPGVYTFATYGNARESMSSRGFRGIPILKNGVRVNSDFRGIGILTDMQGVESIQVLKGAAAITQGVATDIGSPGGVINIVTKTPRFVSGGAASLRVGSWGQVRPAFDVYGPLNESKTLAFRLNGVYEHVNSYRTVVSQERFYVNPSLEWRPDTRTTVTLEMDYMNDSRTPDPGTINLATNDINAIYDLPYDKFLGFESNRSVTKNATFAARFVRELNDKLNIRAAYYRSNLDTDNVNTSLSTGGGRSPLPRLELISERYRTIGNGTRIDNNSVLQLDLVGQDVYTGSIKHTFQIGVDFRTTFLETGGASMASNQFVDIINVLDSTINNRLPGTGFAFFPAVKDDEGNITQPARIEATNSISLTPNNKVYSSNNAYGLMAQDVVYVTDWAKAFFGVRYSSSESTGSATNGYSRGFAIDPQLGVMLSPKKGLNVFGSYTTSTSLRGADNMDVNGHELGNQHIDQLEAGIKSDWLNNRLRFNLTLFKINNKNMSIPVYDANWNETGYYQKGGNDERKGVEVELVGRLLPNLEIVTGYSYIDAQYKEHVSYYEGSAPLNTPKHTANAWANYTVVNGALKGLNVGLGSYYIGERPVNDYATAVTHEGIVPGQKPFDISAYTIVNAQLGYNYNNYGFRLLMNNVFDEIGYNAYRTSFINQIDPRSFAGVVSYRF